MRLVAKQSVRPFKIVVIIMTQVPPLLYATRMGIVMRRLKMQEIALIIADLRWPMIMTRERVRTSPILIDLGAVSSFETLHANSMCSFLHLIDIVVVV